MKVLLVIPHFYPSTQYGGPIFSTFHTFENLSKNGVEVYVSTTNASKPLRLSKRKESFNENFHVNYHNDTFLDRLSLPQILKLKKEIKDVDIIHVQYLFHLITPITLLLCFLFNKKVVLSPRGSLADFIMENGIPFKKNWLRLLINPFKKRIVWHATSNQEKQEIHKYFKNPTIFIVPNGINQNEFILNSEFNKEAYIREITKSKITFDYLIVSMGRLYAKKGFDILIKSFELLIQDYPNAILCIAGSNDGEYDNLIKLIDDLELDGKVFLVGELKDEAKLKFYNSADVFVLPSHNENFGNVYLESLISGTPIVASTNTPWSDVNNMQSGKWVPNTIEDTANAIKELLEYDNKEVLMKNAKNHALRYSWDSVAKSFMVNYKKILNGAGFK